MSKAKWIARTVIFLALLICLQFTTQSLGQFVTGSCVNFVLAIYVAPFVRKTTKI